MAEVKAHPALQDGLGFSFVRADGRAKTPLAAVIVVIAVIAVAAPVVMVLGGASVVLMPLFAPFVAVFSPIGAMLFHPLMAPARRLTFALAAFVNFVSFVLTPVATAIVILVHHHDAPHGIRMHVNRAVFPVPVPRPVVDHHHALI